MGGGRALAESADAFAQSLCWPDFREVYAYWRSKCVGDRLPSRQDIDPTDIPGLLHTIFLVDVIRTPGHAALGFRFRLAGSGHFEINGCEITGRTIDETFDPGVVPAVRAAYSQVVETRSPQVARSHAGIKGREHVRIDRILLPLASDGQTVDMLLGYLHLLMDRD